ncbi:response regulator [Undibacterium fentianense]|uniref:histidine kinase n=1 Tax=Undibacterium fentianense TaxID=2828728 RepID=A0A941IG95_9BURK|nr:response regulator [Undibacterium fentianense]MBR7801571.1 response regulator [Undibacterium fentianense]
MSESPIILCVDDDTTVLVALRTLLSHAFGNRYVIEIAESGAEALEILDDLEQQGKQLSIVISDFIMPGMRGDELLISLHQRSPQTITIMLTGQSDFEGVKKAINQANLYRFLEKPFNHDDIILTVKSAFLAYEHERTLTQQNTQLRQLNIELETMLKQVQESERLLEERVLQRTHELDEKNHALQQALRTLEDVERIARHDLKTPLVSISAAPGLLRAGRTLSAHEEEILSMIESASNRALSMVNLSLDLFRMESGSYVFRPSSVDLLSLASSIVLGLSAQAMSKGIQLHVEAEGENFFVEADDSLCYSILGNLTKNAIEAAPENSDVELRLIKGEWIELRIHNAGAVPLALRENFFAKYATAGKSGGTGLGTYSSHLLATVQGGQLHMQTSDDEGTTLTLCLKHASLPLKSNQIVGNSGRLEQALSSAADRSETQGITRVLLVDDDDFNQMVMADYIEQANYELDSAINGRMALDRVASKRPDVIILDLEMPIMGGIEALRLIRQFQMQAKQEPSFIIAYSGNDDDLSRQSYLDIGFDACLSKPSSREEVVCMLARACQSYCQQIA